MDLHRYCADEESRPELAKPFSYGEWTYATNGRVIVRVPRLPDVPEVTKAPADKAQQLFEVHANDSIRPAGRVSLPGPEEGEDCSRCEGRGHLHDCPTCHCTCRDCNGSGVPPVGANVSVGIGEGSFQGRYYALIKDLPSLKLGTPDKEKPMRFAFEGGEGLLMPMVGERQEHIKMTFEDAAPQSL